MIYQPSTTQIDDGVIISASDLNDYAKVSDLSALQSEVTELQTAVAGKAGSTHGHSIQQIDQLEQTLASKLDNKRYSIAQILDNPQDIGVLNNPKLIKFKVGDDGDYEVKIDEHGYLSFYYNNTQIGYYDCLAPGWNFDGIATSSHTHTIFETPSTNSGDVLTLYGNYKYSRFNVGKDSSSGLAVYGYNCENNNDKYAYIKVKNQSTELEVHTDRVKVTNGDLYVGNTNVITAINGKAASSHTHSMADITDIHVSTHTHAISEITDLQTTLDGKAASSHTHTVLNNASSGYPLTIYGGDSATNRLILGQSSSTNNAIFGSYTGSTPYAYMKLASGSTNTELLVYTDKVKVNNGDLYVGSTNVITAINGKAASNHTHQTIDNVLTVNGSIKIRSMDGYYLKNDEGETNPYLKYDNDVHGLGISSGGINVPGESIFGGDVIIKPLSSGSYMSHALIFETGYCNLHMNLYYDESEVFSRADDEHVKLMMSLNDDNGDDYEIYLTYSKEVGKLNSETVLHTALMNNSAEFNNLALGMPVFADGNTYKIVNDEFIASTDEDYTDCVPGCTVSGTYKTFLGICVKKYAANTRKLNGVGLSRYIEFTQNCIEFATHGDYLFKTATPHSEVTVGDTIMYDGSVVNDEQPMTNRVSKSIVGTVTKIFNSTTFAVFKT